MLRIKVKVIWERVNVIQLNEKLIMGKLKRVMVNLKGVSVKVKVKGKINNLNHIKLN